MINLHPYFEVKGVGNLHVYPIADSLHAPQGPGILLIGFQIDRKPYYKMVHIKSSEKVETVFQDLGKDSRFINGQISHVAFFPCDEKDLLINLVRFKLE